MRENENRIDEEHRKELLRFLLVKTAAVRQGVKPAELLRVRHCYASVNAEGFRVCLYRSDIYGILGLDYVELKVEAESSLVLFYNPSTLATTLSERRNARWLARMGYPSTATADVHLSAMLSHLVRRAAECSLTGESIFSHDRNGKVAAAYEALTKEVEDIERASQNRSGHDWVR